MEIKISKHMNDIIQKHANALFRNVTLEFYGIKMAKIKELINVELPVIEVSRKSTDFIGLAEDDSYVHIEFETEFNTEILVRAAAYDLLLYKRDKRRVYTVVIYASEVEAVPVDFNIGTLSYNPQIIMMKGYNGNTIYAELEEKIKSGQELTDIDMLNLMLLPLMKNTMPRKEIAANSIKLAMTIKDTTKRNACIASAFAFASKYLKDNELEKLMEVLRMSDLAMMFIEEGIQKGIQEGMKEGMKEGAVMIAKNAIRSGLSENIIKEITGLPSETIRRLQDEMNK